MSQSRIVVGLAVGSGLEGTDAALLRVEGTGLSAVPRVVKALRQPFAPDLRDALQQGQPRHRATGEAMALAVRRICAATNVDNRDLFCIGLMAPHGRELLAGAS